MKNPLFYLCLSWGVSLFGTFCLAAPREEQRQLLSVHETEAVFAGLKAHRCMGRTSLCPDECGHSGTLATFEQLRYTRYEKPGEYGDPKTDRYEFMIEDNRKISKVSTDLRDKISALKTGDKVVLHWVHEYVTRDGSSFPERTVLRLERANALEPGSVPWCNEVGRRLGIPAPENGGPAILTAEWYDKVGELSGVIDSQGHGPDSGTEEWLLAVQFKVFTKP